MRNLSSNPALTRLAVAALVLLLAVAFTGSAFAQDSEATKTVKVKVMKHVACDGDDCEEAGHTMHAGQGGNVMVFRTHGDDGDSEGNVRKLFINKSGQRTVLSGDDKAVWVSANSDDMSFGGGAFLGVQMVELTDALRNRFDVRDGVGVMVSEVVAGSPAEAAGIQAGDIITAVDGEEISGGSALSRKMRSFEEGENVAFEISSDGAARVVNATLAKREGGVAKLRTFGGPDSDHKMMRFRSHGQAGDGNIFVHECNEEDGDCDVEMIVEKVIGQHGGDHTIKLDGIDFDGLDCGDSEHCEIQVACENGTCVCTVDGSEVACGS